MEPEVWSPNLQEPAICLYPEPDKSSPSFPSYFLKNDLNIILPSTPRYFK
jgi:hypothetical protein